MMTVKLSEPEQGEAMDYMNRWFWPLETLANACQNSVDDLRAMIDGGCGPGIIYNYHPDTGWWSALGAFMGQAPTMPPEGGQNWYSPAALWWFRRATVLIRQGLNPEEATQKLQQGFGARFADALRGTPQAREAFADCFDEGGTLIESQARAVAQKEWQAWIKGGYAVCLRDFSAVSCVRKGVSGAALKKGLSDKTAARADEAALLTHCQELSSILTPFAPWERASGTPGKTIDVALDLFDMSEDFPYPFAGPLSRV